MIEPALAPVPPIPAPAGATLPPGQSARHPDSWAAYGRFIFASVQKRLSRAVRVSEDGSLYHFRRRVLRFDASLLYAYQDCREGKESIWATATRALSTLKNRERVDHLSVFVAGGEPSDESREMPLRTVLGGEFVGLAFPTMTRDILEFPEGFDGFLRSLGHSNRRHLKARQKSAVEAGLSFEMSADYEKVSRSERHALGRCSSPAPYEEEVLDAWDGYALAQPGFFQCSLRDNHGKLLSYSTGFFEQDGAVMMYQLNDVDQSKAGLSMALRGNLIGQCAEQGAKRLVLPMGVGGHLSHAATTNPIAQVLFVRRSLPAMTKALFLRLLVPKSHAAHMVTTPGFVMRVIGAEPE